MSDVLSRPAASRGRSSARGGRGARSSGTRSSTRHPNGDLKQPSSSSNVDTSADQGELGELKRKHLTQLSTLKEMFPDWADVDLVLALEETDGDLPRTIDHITEGNVSQFAEIKKKTKDRSRSKVKEGSAAPESSAPTTRSGRSRGASESARGGRGRPDRGRGGFRGAGRGGSHTTPNGARSTGPISVPTNESSAWETHQAEGANGTQAMDHAVAAPASDVAEPQWGAPTVTGGAPKPTAADAKKPAAPVPEKKTWASMFAKPKPAPAPPKPAMPQPPPPAEKEPEAAPEPATETESPPIPPVADEIPATEEVEADDVAHPTPLPENQSQDQSEIPPSHDELTEENLEHLPDVSHSVPTDTVASTVASSRDPGSVAGAATPLTGSQQAPIGRPGMSGFATTAQKATASVSGRSASFQRRILEQQEAVVMPGNHAVDIAAVQFGSMGLNDETDADGLDVDEDREEAETRTQPPQASPPSQPRASLPPAPRQASVPAETQSPQEALPTPKQAPGLAPMPAVPQQQPQPPQQAPQGQQAPQPTQPSQGGMPQHVTQNASSQHPYGQFGGRFGQPGVQSEQPSQKPYDPFGQQIPQPNQFEGYPSQGQAQSQAPQQQPTSTTAPSHLGSGFSSAPHDLSYYTSGDQRSAYNYYSGAYGQHGTNQQDAGANQQRTGSAFGSTPGDAAFPGSQAQQTQGRYGDTQNSGHNTPNPAGIGSQQPQQQQQPSSAAQSQPQTQHLPPQQHQQQQQHHGQPGHGYPYSHPYYNSAYFNSYMNQYNSYNQGFSPFGGKGGMYGPHHGYGLSPQTSYDAHSSSPANVGGFGGGMHGRDSTALGSGSLDTYGRTGSTQPSQTAPHTSSTFGAVPDVFGRSQSGFPGQSQPYGAAQQQQPSVPGQGDDTSLKPFGDAASKTGGPSPSALGGAQPGRPGSAANPATTQANQSAGLPPPASHQQAGFGAYPGHLNHGLGGQGSQYAGLGGLGAQHGAGTQSHQGGYGGYSAGFGGYGGYRGGWGGNYGNH
ncbi:hypothetical protein BDY21DRAFT_371278 [Lineolata rhizophorae]|uniref:RNA polymerase II degradation factor 1 n=1 Tax=Lineolata rhizophorae TaxID=578093 RepID=A0A6A6P126_9PEZI|nr:hypothetical protein BDY21DRAFT_371278 [Lineolata rhizophorae]